MNPPLLLIVEDDPIQQQLFCLLLTRLGYPISVVGDGVQALAFLREHAVSLVILDVYLPRLNGIEVLRAIRADDQLVGLKVLLLTASPRQILPPEVALSDGLLAKPTTRGTLEQAVQALLQEGQAAATP